MSTAPSDRSLPVHFFGPAPGPYADLKRLLEEQGLEVHVGELRLEGDRPRKAAYSLAVIPLDGPGTGDDAMRNRDPQRDLPRAQAAALDFAQEMAMALVPVLPIGRQDTPLADEWDAFGCLRLRGGASLEKERHEIVEDALRRAKGPRAAFAKYPGAAEALGRSTEISLTGDGPSNRILVTRDLWATLCLASRLGLRKEEGFDVNHDGLAIALAWGGGGLGRRVRFRLERAEAAGGDVLSRMWSRTDLPKREEFERLSAEVWGRIGGTGPWIPDSFRVTRSTFELVERALRLLEETHADRRLTPLDVRHLLGALLIPFRGGLPHDGAAATFLGGREPLLEALLHAVDGEAREELPYWLGVCEASDPQFRPPADIGLCATPRIENDLWTRSDRLGFAVYVDAIQAFLQAKSTRAPLAISIHAPWGGGKTSLMRMLRERLDAAPPPPTQAKPDPLPSRLRKRLGLPRSDFSIGHVRRAERGSQAPWPKIPDGPVARRHFTVWFNVWQYESTNQVWAGFVDALLTAVADRLPPPRREEFFLRLNLKRLDRGKIRAKLTQLVLEKAWKWALAAFVPTASAIHAWLGDHPLAFAALLAAAPVSAFLGWVVARTRLDAEAAAPQLEDWVAVPNYDSELGFVHRVEEDLRHILECVPETLKPIVVFVDDLDRCTSTKVAQVTEALNLFLAGELSDCVFVLGIDAELVAASLQAHHKELLAQLPKDSGTPLGWRFMDKFVQLPVFLPRPDPRHLDRYVKGMRAADTPSDAAPAPNGAGAGTLPQLPPPSSGPGGGTGPVPAGTNRPAREGEVPEAAQRRVRRLRVAVDRLSDDDPVIQALALRAANTLQGNPREVKRFVNMLRFQITIWLARRSQGEPIPSLEQLGRWTLLNLIRPDFARWLRRGGGRVAAGSGVAPSSKLRRLEDLADQANQRSPGAVVPGSEAPSTKPAAGAGGAAHAGAEPARCEAEAPRGGWREGVSKAFELEPKETPWLQDALLEEFFREEALLPPAERMSAAADCGFW
ncbi:MAG: hypothetical protein HYZ53_24300 [Planctomycetes bacterium]|nr:hypothetical protein [Planctomycetota bacterium]